MFTSTRRNRCSVFLAVPLLAVGIGLAAGQAAYAHGGGGHGAGGHGGGFGGGHIGGFGGGHIGGFGGFGGRYGGFGGFGRGFYGVGLGYGLGGFGGYGWGYPYYGYGLGYGGYPWYGYSSYPYYGYGYSYPYYTYNSPTYGYGYGYPSTFSYSSAYGPPTTGASVAPGTPLGTQSPTLGIEAQEVVEPDGQRAMRVARIYPGTAAEEAGLQVGDVIRSANGYLTQVPGNLEWIMGNAAADNILKLTVHSASDGHERMIQAKVRK
jgi:hypothetical protein